MLRPLAHSSVASNHSILTHSVPNLNIRHLATARASDSSYICLTMFRVINFRMYVCIIRLFRITIIGKLIAAGLFFAMKVLQKLTCTV